MSDQCVCKTSNETDLTCLVSIISNAASHVSPAHVWNRTPIRLNDVGPIQLNKHERTEIDGLDLGLSLATLLDALEQCQDVTSPSDDDDETLDLATLLDALKQCQDATSTSLIGDDDDDDDASVDSLSYYRRSGRLTQKNE